jgi:translation initiation factor 1
MGNYQIVYSTDSGCALCGKHPCECSRRQQKAAQSQRPASSAKTGGGGNTGPGGSKAGASAKPSGPPGAKIRLERGGRGGKAVTVIFELSLPEAEQKTLLRDLQKACGTGGTLKNGTIEIQGDHRDKIEAALQAKGLRVKRAGG